MNARVFETNFKRAGRVLGVIRDRPGITPAEIFEVLERPAGGISAALAYLEYHRLVERRDGGSCFATTQPIEPIRASERMTADPDLPRHAFVRGWHIRQHGAEFALLYNPEPGSPWKLFRRRCGWWRREWTGNHGDAPPIGVDRVDPLSGIPYSVWASLHSTLSAP